METYRILADMVVVFHFAWIALLLGGILLSMQYDWYKKIHMVVVTTTLVSQILFLGCPLVTLENALRRQYDPNTTYGGSFVCYYLDKYLGIQVSPIFITLLLVGILIISGFIFLHHPKRQRTTQVLPVP